MCTSTDGECNSTEQLRKRPRLSPPQDNISCMVNQTESVDLLNVCMWSPRAKYLINKMRLLRFINENTSSEIIYWLAKIADKLFIYAGYGKTGDGLALLRRLKTGNTTIDRVLSTEYEHLANGNEREDKEIYWIFSSAFLIFFYDIKARKPFCVQYYHPKALKGKFLLMYPEFLDQGSMQRDKLLTFHLCMQVAASAFKGAQSAHLLELVTCMTEGSEVALLLHKQDEQRRFVFQTGESNSFNIKNCKELIFQKIYEVARVTASTAVAVKTEKKSVRFNEELEQVAPEPKKYEGQSDP